MSHIIFDCEIQGTAPLLQDNIEGSEKDMLTKKKRSTGGVKDNPEEWKTKLYKYNGGLGHPSAAIESALIQAARDFKADKKRSMREVVKALVYVPDLFITLDRQKPDDVRRDSVVNPHTKGRGFVYRPLFTAGWKATFPLGLADTEVIEVDRLKEIFDYAGQRIGIGAWRPKFGRFIVTKFKERK